MVCKLGKSNYEVSDHWLLVEEGETLLSNIFTSEGLYLRDGDIFEIPLNMLIVDVITIIYHKHPYMLINTLSGGIQRVNLTVPPQVVRADLVSNPSMLHLFVKQFTDGLKQEIIVFQCGTF